MRARTLTCFLAMIALAHEPALAQQAAQALCQEVAGKARRNLLNGLRESADELFCAKGWLSGTSSIGPCFVGNTAVNLYNGVREKWNALFAGDAEWANWGPRAIGAEPETGTIQGGFKRTYFGPASAASTSTIVVRKTGGQARGFVTVCELDLEANVIATHRREFPNGRDLGRREIALQQETQNRIVGIVIDAPAGLNSFGYELRLRTTPDRTWTDPVDGIADLHIHAVADRGFAGRVFWGSSLGPKAQALAPEFMLDPRMDANRYLLLEGGYEERSEDGYFQTQVGRGGFPDFEAWPRHAERSHQQSHISWIAKAHEQGLNLMVVSLVNNNLLCTMLKHVDPTGNIGRFNAAGERTGWESAPWGCSDQENVIRQLEALHELERTHSWFRIAMTPWHARQIISEGGLAVVVSIETDGVLQAASAPLGFYGNYMDQLDEYRALGVTTLQIVHETDSRFCGAAPHRDALNTGQMFRYPFRGSYMSAFIDHVLETPGRPAGNANDLRELKSTMSNAAWDRDASGRNRRGLTDDGRDLVDAMVARHMPIDLAHTSERCRQDIFAHVPSEYGFYDSHTKFERLLNPALDPAGREPAGFAREEEFLITEELLPLYRQRRVLVGLRTAAVDVNDAPVRGQLAAIVAAGGGRSEEAAGRNRAPVPAGPAVPNTCPGSSRSYAQLVDYADQKNLDIAFATDINGMIAQLGPRFGENRCYAAGLEGFTGRPVLPEPEAPAVTRGGAGARGAGVAVERNAEGEIVGARQLRPTFETTDNMNYDEDGLVTIAQLPDLLEDLRSLGTPGVDRLAESAEAYIRMWERAYAE
jgi:microsomal dipeptidase-like Zn-dependent dipeptidase